MVSLIGIYGASGFGREVMPIARQQYGSDQNVRFVFIDDAGEHAECNGYAVMTWQQFLEAPADNRSVSIAIADENVRELLTKRCADANVSLCDIVADNVVVGDQVTTGSGVILQPFVSLTSNVIIGRSFHANIYSYVAHDCVIGDYVTFAPRVMCNGNVHIGDYAYIGTGAIIRQGTPDKPLRIGARAVIGMGAVVTKDVPEGVTVVGNPARIMEKR